MAESSLIREFLVGLGFKVDVDSQKKFKDGVEDATKKTEQLDKAQVKAGKSAVTMAASIAGTGAWLTSRVTDFASKLEKLHFESKRTGAAASSLKAVANAAQDVGVSADEAAGSIENVARFMRNNPASESYIASLGVQTRDANGHLRDTVDIVNDLGKSLAKQKPWLAKQYADNLGISENFMLGMRDPTYFTSYDRAKKDYVNSNVDSSNNSGHNLMSSLRHFQSGMEGTFGTVGTFGLETGATLGGGILSYFAAKNVIQAAVGKALGAGADTAAKTAAEAAAKTAATSAGEAAAKVATTATEAAAKTAVSQAAATAAGDGAAAAAGGAGKAAGWFARALPWAGRLLGAAGLMLHSDDLNTGEDEYLAKRRAAGGATPFTMPTDTAPAAPTARADAPVAAGAPAAANAPATRAERIRDAMAAARHSEEKYGVPALVSFAQWTLESASGSRMPVGSNNPFGIKAKKGQDYVEAMTNEVINGQLVRVKQKFAKFATLADAFDAHAKLLAEGSPYAAARGHLDDRNAYADALTGVYATDPKYGDKLKKIMDNASQMAEWRSAPQDHQARGNHIEIKQDVSIQVAASSSADATARSVAREFKRVNDGIVRNMQGVTG
ncbi:glycoside hydrolase family 73 protein [Paraburkholderia tropica]|uniref:glycoside hydrolase family 73 protein n=1 Tax=Paraburkholderia tropica TaxID=92647 RepID=UPI003D2D5F55